LPRLLADVSIAGEATGHQVEEASRFGGVRAFSSFAVDDSAAASKFYGEMLGLRVSEEGGALMAALGR
jgi:catechol-2,3-dioxygenase